MSSLMQPLIDTYIHILHNNNDGWQIKINKDLMRIQEMYAVNFCKWLWGKLLLSVQSNSTGLYLWADMALSRFEWQVRADEATIAFCGSTSGAISN